MLDFVLESLDEFGPGKETVAVALVQEQSVVALKFLVRFIDQKAVHKQACVAEFGRVGAVDHVDKSVKRLIVLLVQNLIFRDTVAAKVAHCVSFARRGHLE